MCELKDGKLWIRWNPSSSISCFSLMLLFKNPHDWFLLFFDSCQRKRYFLSFPFCEKEEEGGKRRARTRRAPPFQYFDRFDFAWKGERGKKGEKALSILDRLRPFFLKVSKTYISPFPTLPVRHTSQSSSYGIDFFKVFLEKKYNFYWNSSSNFYGTKKQIFIFSLVFFSEVLRSNGI